MDKSSDTDMIRQTLSRWKESFFGAVQQVEQRTDAFRQEADASKIDWAVIGVIIVASVMLTLQDYYGSSNDWRSLEALIGLFVDQPKEVLDALFRDKEYGRLARLWYWSLATSCCYVVGPVLYIKFVLRERVRDYGFRVRGILSHAWIYIAMFAIVLPALFVVGGDREFSAHVSLL